MTDEIRAREGDWVEVECKLLDPADRSTWYVAVGSGGGSMCAGLVLLVRYVGGAPLPRWTYAVPPLVGALLWPVLTVTLQWTQRPQRSSAEL